jgi:hypothetical protein
MCLGTLTKKFKLLSRAGLQNMCRSWTYTCWDHEPSKSMIKPHDGCIMRHACAIICTSRPPVHACVSTVQLLCMYVIYMNIYVYIFIYIYIYHIYVYTCVCVYICACVGVYIYIYIYICMYVGRYVYIQRHYFQTYCFPKRWFQGNFPPRRDIIQTREAGSFPHESACSFFSEQTFKEYQFKQVHGINACLTS